MYRRVTKSFSAKGFTIDAGCLFNSATMPCMQRSFQPHHGCRVSPWMQSYSPSCNHVKVYIYKGLFTCVQSIEGVYREPCIHDGRARTYRLIHAVTWMNRGHAEEPVPRWLSRDAVLPVLPT